MQLIVLQFNDIMDTKAFPIWVGIVVVLLVAFNKNLFPWLPKFFEAIFKNKDVKIVELQNEINELKKQYKELIDNCEKFKDQLKESEKENALIKGYFIGLQNSLSKMDIILELPKLESKET